MCGLEGTMSAKAVAQIMGVFGPVVRVQLDVDSNNYPIGVPDSFSLFDYMSVTQDCPGHADLRVYKVSIMKNALRKDQSSLRVSTLFSIDRVRLRVFPGELLAASCDRCTVFDCRMGTQSQLDEQRACRLR